MYIKCLPLTRDFYIVKLESTGVYNIHISFFFLSKTQIVCIGLNRLKAFLTCTYNHDQCFEQQYGQFLVFCFQTKIFIFILEKNHCSLHTCRHLFVMSIQSLNSSIQSLNSCTLCDTGRRVVHHIGPATSTKLGPVASTRTITVCCHAIEIIIVVG